MAEDYEAAECESLLLSRCAIPRGIQLHRPFLRRLVANGHSMDTDIELNYEFMNS